MSNRKRFVFVV